MEIRDVIQGSIAIEKHELPILDSRFFQRLRQIKQLGFAELSYPNATHNRYVHSLGAMESATQAFDTIFGGHRARAGGPRANGGFDLFADAPDAHARLQRDVRQGDDRAYQQLTTRHGMTAVDGSAAASEWRQAATQARDRLVGRVYSRELLDRALAAGR